MAGRLRVPRRMRCAWPRTSWAVRRTTAEVLIRRGHATADAARAFLDRTARHTIRCSWATWPPRATRIERAIAAGEPICVHGDYDADGICATALAVTVLRELGAEVEWHLPEPVRARATAWPSRRSSGWRATASRCCITVDCGITAVDAVRPRRGARARRHRHRPPPARRRAARRARWCAPARPTYPFPELCGTGVVLQARAGACARGPAATRPSSTRHLDLVALATVADVVPLADENRRLVRAACAGCAAHDRARPARADGARRASTARTRAGVRSRIPARAAHQRRRPAGRSRARRSSSC